MVEVSNWYSTYSVFNAYSGGPAFGQVQVWTTGPPWCCQTFTQHPQIWGDLGRFCGFRDAPTCPDTMRHFSDWACTHLEWPSTTSVGRPFVIERTGLEGNQFATNMHRGSEACENDQKLCEAIQPLPIVRGYAIQDTNHPTWGCFPAIQGLDPQHKIGMYMEGTAIYHSVQIRSYVWLWETTNFRAPSFYEAPA